MNGKNQDQQNAREEDPEWMSMLKTAIEELLKERKEEGTRLRT